MPNKTDLSAYKVDISRTLPKHPSRVQDRNSSKTGPKPKLPEEKQSKTISLTFTPSQYKIIEKKR